MPGATHTIRWTQMLVVALSGVGAFILYAAIILTLAIQGLLVSESAKLDALISETEKLALEAESVINRLNGSGFDDCSDELLAIMRRELFLASRIRDIGFVRGNTLLCTTGQGVLKTPLEQDPWDFISKEGFRYWPAARLVLFDGNMTVPIAGKGNFNVVFDTRWLEQLTVTNTRWGLAYQHGNAPIRHTYGDASVFRGLDEKPGEVITPAVTYSESCSALIPYCAGIEVRHLDVIKRHKVLSAYLFLIGLVLGAGAGLVTWLILQKRQSTEHRIIRGLKQNAYFPLYQPIVDLEKGKVVGCEVLARFSDAYGALYPDEFIPVLARARLGWAFTRLIMQKTLDDLSPRAGLPDGFKVNINLFPSDIAQSKMKGADISRSLAASRFHIAFEITENEQLDTAAARDCIGWIQQNGFELAVDDFGTGYSNLSEVRDLGCNTLKIDRSFIFDIDTGGLGAALVPLMVRIADELGMEVVAEGVETLVQADIVRNMGVRFAQGWAFGKAMPANELEVCAETLKTTR